MPFSPCVVVPVQPVSIAAPAFQASGFHEGCARSSATLGLAFPSFHRPPIPFTAVRRAVFGGDAGWWVELDELGQVAVEGIKPVDLLPNPSQPSFSSGALVRGRVAQPLRNRRAECAQALRLLPLLGGSHKPRAQARDRGTPARCGCLDASACLPTGVDQRQEPWRRGQGGHLQVHPGAENEATR